MELLRIADDVVELAFRVGMEALRQSTHIEQSNESWAVLVSNVDINQAKEAIEQFNTTVLERSHKAYISAFNITSITVSGPPSMLARVLSQSDVFEHARNTPLPIWSAFHASHLDHAPWNWITEGLSSVTQNTMSQRSLLISPSSGQPYSGTSLSEILPEVLNDIFRVPIDIKAAVEGLSCYLDTEVVLVSIGPTNSAKTIKKSLALKAIELSELENNKPGEFYQTPDPNAIAIVGMAARLPGSETLDEFWQILEEGRDLHEKIRPDRFDLDSHFDPSGQKKNTTLSPYGVFMDRPGFFDTRLFNMSPREAAQTDPQQRLLLLTTYEALEMAGYQPNATPSTSTRRIGSYIGQTSDDYREVNASQNIDTFFITGGIRAFGPGRLNYHFGWEGPSYSVDTACSSSAASIQLACSALLARECDMAIGGGANLLTSPDLFAGLSRGSFLSKTGGCKTFDDNADGYVRADAVGIVVLKRLADAHADRDNILAIVKGATTNHSAEAVSITHPHAGTQERLFRAVLGKAGLCPQDIDYVELHGTGTQAGDATESKSVTNVLGHGRSSPLYIGTVKPNLGHGEAASGITSLIKATLMFRKNLIVPHVGVKGTINHKLPPLAEFNTHIAFNKTQFKARDDGDGKRRILINNFDAAGGNTSMIIEEAPKLQVYGIDPRRHHVVAVSAKTPKAFVENSRMLLRYITEHPETRLEDIAYTTTGRRMHHELRQGHAVSSLDELSAALRTTLANEASPKKAVYKPAPVFLFTGQGSLYPGMASDLFKTHGGFRRSIIEYDRICVSHGFTSFLPLIADKNNDRTIAQQVQLAIVSVELAIAEIWKALGVSPCAVIGHSLGEYPALYTAGVISLSDCLYLVGKRASLMSDECTPGTHSMLAIRQGPSRVESLLQENGVPGCEIACENSPESTVVSGDMGQIRRLKKTLVSRGIQTTSLEVQFAFHSAQMDPVLEKYENIAKKVHFRKPAIPFASALLGQMVVDEGVINANYLKRQTRERVQFSRALISLKSKLDAKGQYVWIETGPNPVCLGLVRSTFGNDEISLPSLKRGEDDWKILSGSAATAYRNGIDIDWSEYHRLYKQSVRLLELPNYAFDLKNYWIQYSGDWSVRKEEQASAEDAIVSTPPAFSTTALQRIESEIVEDEDVTVTFVTSASEPKLNKALRGHLVNGAGLCPSSVYADMAFTAASYLQSRTSPTRNLSMDVREMEVHKPLIIQPGDTKQIIRVVARQHSSSDVIRIEFSSQDGDEVQDHAHCTVIFGNGDEWKSSWLRNAYLIKSRMDHLVASSAVGQTHKILRPLVYKLFSVLVDYDPKYQGMEEVYLDSSLLEATANVKFATEDSDGVFTCSPYWIDSIAHLSGFVLNGADTAPADSVYISHGWGSMKIVGKLSADARYQSYVRMQMTRTAGVLSGDVYFFENGEVIAVCEDLKFQRIKKTILDHVIPRTVPRKVQLPKPTTRALGKHTPVAKRDVQGVPPGTGMVWEFDPAIFGTVLEAIASEVGVELDELSDDILFSDIGVDSLLSISIVARLGTILGEVVPTTLFSECIFVRDLRQYIGMRFGERLTPSTDGSMTQSLTGSEGDTSTDLSTPAPEPYLGGAQPFDELRKVIAQEVGLAPDEIDESTPLSDYGVDSLLSLSILATINTAGMDLPSSFLINHPTLTDIRDALGGLPISPAALTGEVAQTARDAPPVRAEAVLLQRGSDKQAPALFLLPDGSGSAGSYMGLPRLDAAGDVYGLNSPFLSSPESFRASLQVAAAMYVREIRRVQPQGPYRLGGWSIGGSYAFEAASQLVHEYGERVDALLLIDAPCPKTLPPLPLETVDLIEELGVFDGLGSKKAEVRERTRRHFASSINALKQYQAAAIPRAAAPKTVLILWAEKGVWERVDATRRESYHSSGGARVARNEASDWIMDPRHDHDANGWDSLLPGADIQLEVVAGDHFSMMQKPGLDELGRKLARVVGAA